METLEESKVWWPPRIRPPKGAPNVLLIMTDDQGYGISGTFGGVIPTLTLDALAADGLRYTEFNSTALCSPTRAALLDWPYSPLGRLRRVSPSCRRASPATISSSVRKATTIGRILKDNGYATAWFGRTTPPSFHDPISSCC